MGGGNNKIEYRVNNCAGLYSLGVIPEKNET